MFSPTGDDLVVPGRDSAEGQAPPLPRSRLQRSKQNLLEAVADADFEERKEDAPPPQLPDADDS
jgi:hypothetical protein